jgi:hypothetical protein
MSVRWLERLRVERPDLAAVADDILEKGEVGDRWLHMKSL